jgi:hypothetical protein
MSDSLSVSEIDVQYAELLPARTVLSLVGVAKTDGSFQCGGNGGHGGNGGDARGGIGVNALNIILYPEQYNFAGNAFGGAGGSADGGPCH